MNYSYMAKFIFRLLIVFFVVSTVAGQNSILISDEDRQLINFHIRDLNEHKNHSVAIGELIAEMNFLASLNPNELSRSEYWLMKVVQLYDLDANQKKIQPKSNFENLKQELYEEPYSSRGFYFEDAFIYDFPEEIESYSSIEISRPYTRNCKGIPSIEKRNECTQKRIQFALKQHFETNQAIAIFNEMNDEVFVRDYEVTIFTHLLIDKKGKLRALHISSFNKNLSRLAHKAIRRFPRFEPARLNGQPIEARLHLPITFTVEANEDN